jgi:hypothetical protein
MAFLKAESRRAMAESRYSQIFPDLPRIQDAARIEDALHLLHELGRSSVLERREIDPADHHRRYAIGRAPPCFTE